MWRNQKLVQNLMPWGQQTQSGGEPLSSRSCQRLGKMSAVSEASTHVWSDKPPSILSGKHILNVCQGFTAFSWTLSKLAFDGTAWGTLHSVQLCQIVCRFTDAGQVPTLSPRKEHITNICKHHLATKKVNIPKWWFPKIGVPPNHPF